MGIFECGGTISNLSKSMHFTNLKPNKMSDEDYQSKTTIASANFLVNLLKELPQHENSSGSSGVIPTIAFSNIQ